jgi:ubiquinone/menaquinone biosynthesis C-methylase UbiE
MANRSAPTPPPRSDAWQNMSKNYNRVKDFTLRFGQRALKRVGLSEDEAFLDVACGPGHLAMFAARAVKARVTAVDSSLETALAADQEVPKLEITREVMNGEALTFPDSTFNVTCSSFGVFLYDDYEKGLTEMVRVTKPGGRIAVLSWAPPKRSVMLPFVKFLEAEAPQLLPLRGLPGWDAMDSMEKMVATLERAGCVDAGAEEMAGPLVVPNAELFADSTFKNPCVSRMIGELEDSERLRLQARFAEVLKSEYGVGEFEIGATAIIGSGAKPEVAE